MKTLLEREGYRFVEAGIIELNGMQCSIAMEDIEYAKWLCGDNAYVKDVVVSPYKKSR